MPRLLSLRSLLPAGFVAGVLAVSFLTPAASITGIFAGISYGGGYLNSGPDSTGLTGNSVRVFYRGSDNGLWTNYWTGQSFTGATTLGGTLTADPAGLSNPNNSTSDEVFVRGTDNGVWHNVWNGTSWSGWSSLGGVASSGPDADAYPGGSHRDVFVKGTDGQLWHRWTDGDGGGPWGVWEPLGGVLTSDPGSVSWGNGHLDVFATGTDNAVWYKAWNGSWSAWQSMGGIASSGPDAGSCTPGHLDVVVRGNDNSTYWHNGFNGSSWTGWSALAGQWTSDPGLSCRPGTSMMDVFGRGTTNALYVDEIAAS